MRFKHTDHTAAIYECNGVGEAPWMLHNRRRKQVGSKSGGGENCVKYVIAVTEKLQKNLVIEAGSADEAVCLVEEAYKNGDVVLTDRDYSGADVQESLCYTREQIDAMEATDTSKWWFQFEK